MCHSSKVWLPENDSRAYIKRIGIFNKIIMGDQMEVMATLGKLHTSDSTEGISTLNTTFPAQILHSNFRLWCSHTLHSSCTCKCTHTSCCPQYWKHMVATNNLTELKLIYCLQCTHHNICHCTVAKRMMVKKQQQQVPIK